MNTRRKTGKCAHSTGTRDGRPGDISENYVRVADFAKVYKSYE